MTRKSVEPVRNSVNSVKSDSNRIFAWLNNLPRVHDTVGHTKKAGESVCSDSSLIACTLTLRAFAIWDGPNKAAVRLAQAESEESDGIGFSRPLRLAPRGATDPHARESTQPPRPPAPPALTQRDDDDGSSDSFDYGGGGRNASQSGSESRSGSQVRGARGQGPAAQGALGDGGGDGSGDDGSSSGSLLRDLPSDSLSDLASDGAVEVDDPAPLSRVLDARSAGEPASCDPSSTSPSVQSETAAAGGAGGDDAGEGDDGLDDDRDDDGYDDEEVRWPVPHGSSECDCFLGSFEGRSECDIDRSRKGTALVSRCEGQS
eukprot:6197897-Pleurochrysis_carterae.AAC.2